MKKKKWVLKVSKHEFRNESEKKVGQKATTTVSEAAATTKYADFVTLV